MIITGSSFKGRRQYNQDRIYHNQYGDSFIMAIADGIGGYDGGEIASRIAIGICQEVFQKFVAAPDMGMLEKVIFDIIGLSQKKIKRESEERFDLSAMGTTLTVVLGCRDEYIVGNIGDSRTYLISGPEIKQVTKDNSFVQEYRDRYPEKEIDNETLRNMSNVLTRSLSGGDDQVDIYPGNNQRFVLKSGEIILLCSDGLIADKLGDVNSSLYRLTREASSQKNALDNLITWAYKKGSTDNISVLLGVKGKWTGSPNR